MLVALALQLDASMADRPKFDVPRHWICRGANRSSQPVNIDVQVAGTANNTTFVLAPLEKSAWPSSPLKIEGQRGSFFKSDDSSLWYWVGTDLDLNRDKYGFGFDVRVSGKGQSALRFSRSKFAPRFDETEVRFDPKGAYLDDVPCQAVNSESAS